MPNVSAGLLMYHKEDGLRVLLVHHGGPFWKNKDAGAWTIPKGVPFKNEDLLEAARREFEEETGFKVKGDFLPLQPVKQKAGKVVHAWAVEGHIDPKAIRSNTLDIEWPLRSGRKISVPEVDRAQFFDPATARVKINAAQVALIDELEAKVDA
jgi:predicted NUDIX family NTP pyrophosphohydrolase